MFYYISFLRPPPLQASLSLTDPIFITPQICNDLQTEYFGDSIDIYYTWSLDSPPSDRSEAVCTKSTKLTSWRPSSAYKAIPVPRPPPLEGPYKRSEITGRNSDDGTAWRLVLTCGTAQSDRAIVLGKTDTTGKTPFGVTSMPVVFPGQSCRRSGNGKNAIKGTGAKQERIVRSYSLPVTLQDHPIVFSIAEQTSFDLDKKIWDSGIGLSSWLVQLFSDFQSFNGTGLGTEERGKLCDLRQALFSTDARHILELGAGTGIVAITLAILRSTFNPPDNTGPGTIITTDLPSAIPILEENITSNHAFLHKCPPRVTVLDWDTQNWTPDVEAQLGAGLDVIVMADVTYNTASFPALIGTLSRLMQRAKNRGPPMVLMGYKERHPDERVFWDNAQAIDIHFQKIAQIDGAGGSPVEIWLG